MLADRDRGTRAVVRRLAWSLTALPLIAMGAFAGCGGDSPSGTSGTGGSGSGGTGSSSSTGGPPASLCIDAQPVNVVPPAGLQVRFRALDCDGNPVRPLASSDVTVFNDEKDVPFGKGGEGDSVSGIGENSNIELYSVLVLDLSNSIHDAGAVDSVIDGAKAFVQETVTKPQASLKHRVTIIAFGRPDQITIEQDFTQDDALLNAKLEALRVAPPRGTTDLYDAYMLALGHVAAAGSGGDTVIERFVVLLTDGTHEAGDEENLRKKALATKHTTDATVYAIGIEGNYDACRLEELSGRGLATTPGAGCRELDACMPGTSKPASCTQFSPGVNQASISKAFQDVAARVAGIARSNYVVGICTPVSLGTPTLTLAVNVDGVKDEDTLSYAVANLNGDVNSCDSSAIQKGQLLCDGSGACQIVCLDKTCGTDLGASCGTCGSKQVCNGAQHCEDVCAGKNCGTDQGIVCGTCGAKQVCNGAQKCEDACASMNCGTDQGIACGTCTSPQYCGAANVCLDPCQGMNCGTDQGVSCGMCIGQNYCDTNVCKAACVGMSCGVDQGVSCGMCTGQNYCDTNVCKAACVGMDCGTDQGVACGTCAGGTGCDAANQCVVCGPGLAFAPNIDYPLGGQPISIASADLNADGKPDFAVLPVNSNTVSVLLNAGNGTFAAKVDYQAGPGVSSVSVADLNGDGKPDLAVANSNSNTVSVLFGNGNGTLAAKIDYAVSSSPTSVTTADLNGDGKPDLAVVNGGGATVSVLLNNGNGVFAVKADYPTGGGPNSVVAADVNGDGKPDLAVANASNTVSVLLNNGNGTFAAKVDYVAGLNPRAIVSADLNGDGKADLAFTNLPGNNVSVLLNGGNGIFASKVDYSVGSNLESLAAADVDGDGKVDLAVTVSNGQVVRVLLNKGNGTFGGGDTYSVASNPRSLAVADLNGDGKLDLAVGLAGNNNKLSVLLSKCVP